MKLTIFGKRSIARKLALVALAVVMLVPLTVIARGQWLRTQVIEVNATITPTTSAADPEVVARGRHLAVAVLACNECHGDHLAGKVVIDSPAFGRVVAPNLTVLSDYAAGDWDRAVRHGVDRSGRPLVLMASDGYASLTNRDLSALVAYFESLSPIADELPEQRLGPAGLLAIGAGKFPLSARHIDHAAVGTDLRSEADPEAEGRYLTEVSGCRSCHGPTLEGKAFGPKQPFAPAITPEALAGWTAEEFDRSLRQGIGRDGEQLDALMPVASFARMTDQEIDALWTFLRGSRAR